jgi:protein-tyrosine phosphatase
VPIRDVHCENIKTHLARTNAFIDEAVAGGGKVLVHCVCGVSRSATIVAAWIMSRHGAYSVEETIELLQSRRGCVNPIPAFREQLSELFIAASSE